MMRLRLAVPAMLVYWAMLLVGLALYGATASDPQTLRSIAVGALVGTAIGNLLALRDVRGTMAAVLVFFTMLWVTSIVPHSLVGSHLWMAYLPAAMCGYWSLGDREALAAFWFPTMVWMLSILDRTATNELDRTGLAFVCALGVMFIVFLRAREARRAKLWQAFAAVPLAAPRAPQLLREAPGRHLARFAWTAMVGGVAIALTAWIAPTLWQLETSHVGKTTQPRAPIDAAGQVIGAGAPESTTLPCCTLDPQLDTKRSRVKEYFDLGRGHDTDEADGEKQQCRTCDVESGYVGGAPEMVASGGDEVVGEPVVGTPDGVEPITSDGVDSVLDSDGVVTVISGGSIASPGIVASVPPSVTPPVDPPPAAVTTPALTTPALTQVAPTPPVARAPASSPKEAPRPHPSGDVAPPPTTTQPIAPESSSHVGGDILRILGLLAAAALLLQLVALALRPVRRAITLRHLRRPFWKETVDQRVSNAWQLALVGLRDAGWCATSEEAPRQFAKRIGVAGLERCAVILERARHGLGIDAHDLTDMSVAAEEAYRAARQGLGLAGRLSAQVRWPLA
ncbi:hypothetical protein BH11MYX2_BH11MYX2_37200 [soil metagenome]